MIRAIAALDNHNGIADDHGIPWQGKLPTDVKYFRDQTKGGILLMGYGFYAELTHPLPDRQNCVVIRPGTELKPGFIPVTDIEAFINEHKGQLIWDGGGAKLFEQTLKYVDELYLTRIDEDFHCTKFFPAFENDFELSTESETMKENGISFRFQVWRRKVKP